MVAIVGIGETAPARQSGKDIRALVLEACTDALADAGLGGSEVDGIVTDSVIMPGTVPADWLAAQLGMTLSFSASLSYGGAAVVAAPMLAEMAIASGRARAVLVYFGVDWGSRPGGPYAFHDAYPAKAAFEKPYGFSAQPAYFALWARRYMHEFGLREEDLADIAVAHRHNAIRTGRAQNRKPLDRDGYFSSRLVADPLRVPDCCLISDGAGAYVVTSRERARDLRRVPVEVRGVGFASAPVPGDDVFTQPSPLLTTPAATRASDQAQRSAKISLGDVDFAEIYDCFTISCLAQIEDLGFCRKGDGAHFMREQGITIDGRLPVNTHGGLLSYSYRLGIEHVVEAVRQLRGDAGDAQVLGAEIGLVGGFSPPDYGVAILTR
ncbi:thiolase family protein [Enterovirga sp. CN4-39]|uniref:thiolase family protein n=1 Tax=Enterovirga sp. CN4-39 TaxID=3400910 RepID=UPI003C0EBA89